MKKPWRITLVLEVDCEGRDGARQAADVVEYLIPGYIDGDPVEVVSVKVGRPQSLLARGRRQQRRREEV
jgi:hypothetical protein